jgi:hydroxyacylglutathione hydrolase
MKHAYILFLAVSLWAQALQPDGAGLQPGTLPDHWATGGPDCPALPAFQIHSYNADFYILRESGCTHYEKPFLYLFFGDKKALLIDTGAGKVQTAAAVDSVIREWAGKHGRDASSIELIVAHSHSHGDHIAGDPTFAGQAHTRVLPVDLAATKQLFQIANWPEDAGSIDLGRRVLTVLPIPGHDALSLAFYDPQTGVLLTGDTLYPGRLYVADYPAFLKSIQRLETFTKGKLIAHVLGNHIEQSSTPFLDYKVGTAYQPQEHQLQLNRGHILELRQALEGMHGTPVRYATADFTIWPKD